MSNSSCNWRGFMTRPRSSDDLGLKENPQIWQFPGFSIYFKISKFLAKSIHCWIVQFLLDSEIEKSPLMIDIRFSGFNEIKTLLSTLLLYIKSKKIFRCSGIVYNT